jgi:hypothetical protein
MSFHLTPRIRLAASAAGFCLFAACTIQEGTTPPPEPRPESRPAVEPLPAPVPAAEPAPEPVPRDACLGCGMGRVATQSKGFLDAYSEGKR